MNGFVSSHWRTKKKWRWRNTKAKLLKNGTIENLLKNGISTFASLSHLNIEERGMQTSQYLEMVQNSFKFAGHWFRLFIKRIQILPNQYSFVVEFKLDLITTINEKMLLYWTIWHQKYYRGFVLSKVFRPQKQSILEYHKWSGNRKRSGSHKSYFYSLTSITQMTRCLRSLQFLDILWHRTPLIKNFELWNVRVYDEHMEPSSTTPLYQTYKLMTLMT